jgi:hypothetical protein
MGRRTLYRAPSVVLAAVLGAVLLSGSDQPVTARSYAHWQELPTPPLSARTHALGVAAHHRVLVLGGHRPGSSGLRDGAAYDLRTGIWTRLRIPVAVTDRDASVAAAGVVVLRHETAGRAASWWRYDVRDDTWTRMRQVPARLSEPSAFGSEVYALSGRRVVVYSVQLGRWTRLAPDPLRPVLADATVTASRAGTVVTGRTTAGHRLVADRWNGLRWRRVRVARPQPVAAPADGSTWVEVAGRIFVLRHGRAWIRLP